MGGIMPPGRGRYHAFHPFSSARRRPALQARLRLQPDPPPCPPPLSGPPPSAPRATRWLAVGSLVGLILLGLAWELWLAPVRPGGSLLALKVLPLVVPLAGLLKNRMYVVRAWSDTLGLSQVLALIEVLLCLVLFAACAWHVRLRLRHAAAAVAAHTLETSAP